MQLLVLFQDRTHNEKRMYFRSTYSSAFALPTVIIASVVMLTVLTSALTATSAVSTNLQSQTRSLQAKLAAEAGLAIARTCLEQNGYVPTWSDTKPLTASTDCQGNIRPECTTPCYVSSTGNSRTDFVVKAPTSLASGGYSLVASGSFSMLRSSTNEVWRTYTSSLRFGSTSSTAPQLGGAAGWKESGHLGLFLTAEGQLYAWGDNSGGVIGDASLGAVVSLPTFIAPPTGEGRIQRITTSGQGASLICAIFVSGNAYCRGEPGDNNNALMQPIAGWQRIGLNTSLQVKEMVVNGYGGDSVCVVASDNQAYCAGENPRGSLGIGDANPRLISSPSRVILPNGLTVKHVFVQDLHACVIASDNGAYCSGANDNGPLGNGTNVSSVIPVRANLPGAVVDIKTTHHSSGVVIYFLTQDGNLYGSGSNVYGTLNDSGPGSNNYFTPRLLRSGVGTMISLGERGEDRHALCAIDRVPVSGTSGLLCMGNNTYGQIGSPCGTTKPVWTNISLGGAQASASLTASAGYQNNSVMVITTDGRAFAWGDNTWGKLGTSHGVIECNPDPRPVALPNGTNVVSVSNMDEYSSFVLSNTSHLYSMGRNDVGQLGNGTTQSSSQPVLVPVKWNVYHW